MRATAFLLAGVLFSPLASGYEVEVLQDNGDSANRIDIAILGDGYRDIDQAQLTSDTQSFLAEFWTAAPLGEYRSFFNVKLVHVISAETGADNGTYGAVRDTALNTYFNCAGVDRLLCVDMGAALTVAGDHVPEYDLVMVIVNDPKYGGSGGTVSVFSINELAGQIAIHEFGHSFAGLADEYEDAYPGYPTCGGDCPEPNVTTRTVREQVKWNPWIEASTPVPTPETSSYLSVVGVFEGARYFSTGLYRPRQNCEMRALSQLFCEVCREALVLSVYARVNPIDARTPASPVNAGLCDLVTFSVQLPPKDPDTFLIVWSVDGQVQATGAASLELSCASLSPGPHTVAAQVSDETSSVRTDTANLLFEQADWTLQVVAGSECTIAGQCVPAGTPDPANPCRECQPAVSTNDWSPDDSNTCDDGLRCNGAEACAGGACQPGTALCTDDGLACTLTCDENSGACNTLQAGACLIFGSCHASGATDPADTCRVCDPARDPGGFSPAADGLACDDGDPCTGGESCQSGICTGGTPICQDGGADAGTDAGPDAGPDGSTDAGGEGEIVISGGCGCAAPGETSAGPLLAWALMVAVLRRRKGSRPR